MGQPAIQNDDLFYTDMPVGEILRRTREHYGQSLQDVERALRIRSSQINHIESGNFDALPGRVYIIGFIRSYAEYLGLDGGRMVGLFKVQSGPKAGNPELHFPVAASDSKIPPFWMLALSFAVLILIISFLWPDQSRDHQSVNEIPEIPARLQGDVLVETLQKNPTLKMGPPAPKVLKQETAAVQKAVENIVLHVKQNSWVEIRDSEGKVIVSRVLKTGEEYFVPPDRPDLKMSLGNAGGVEIGIGAEKFSLGGPGDVIRDIALDTSTLIKSYGNKE